MRHQGPRPDGRARQHPLAPGLRHGRPRRPLPEHGGRDAAHRLVRRTGTLTVVPGSHGQTLPYTWERRFEGVPILAIETEPGDVTVHIADVMHASPAAAPAWAAAARSTSPSTHRPWGPRRGGRGLQRRRPQPHDRRRRPAPRLTSPTPTSAGRRRRGRAVAGRSRNVPSGLTVAPAVAAGNPAAHLRPRATTLGLVELTARLEVADQRLEAGRFTPASRSTSWTGPRIDSTSSRWSRLNSDPGQARSSPRPVASRTRSR